jgi:hypothetical protein
MRLPIVAGGGFSDPAAAIVRAPVPDLITTCLRPTDLFTTKGIFDVFAAWFAPQFSFFFFFFFFFRLVFLWPRRIALLDARGRSGARPTAPGRTRSAIRTR